MKKTITVFYLLLTLVFTTSLVYSQTPSDAIMMEKSQICLGAIYDFGSFDQYWEGDRLRSNATIEKVSRNVILNMVAIGIMDRLNLIVSVPYVQTKSSEPNGGKFVGVSGFQDIGFALKGEILNKQIGAGKLSALGTIGYSTPVTNYLSDYMPYSIGSGADVWSFRGIVQYKLDNGFYARTSVAYLLRGQTEAERDYYYNNGSYYTSWMDVPNAWNYNLGLGKNFFDNSLKIEANYTGFKSISGDDIRSYNAAQPTNRVEYDEISFLAQYYFKKLKGFGVLGGYSQVVDGRNISKLSNFKVGLTYAFKI
jgi:hypothetical protein